METRRVFIKKVLPMLAALGMPIRLVALDVVNNDSCKDCNNLCKASCNRTCKMSCRDACTTSCARSCSFTCANACNNTCRTLEVAGGDMSDRKGHFRESSRSSIKDTIKVKIKK